MVFPARAAHRAGSPRLATGATAAVLSVSAVALLAGLAGAAPPVGAAALATAPVAALLSARLMRLALALHAATRTFGPCRGAGFLGMGVIAGGATTVAAAVVPAGVRGPVFATGVALTATAHVLGLLLLPGAATTVAGRLRRGLDGLSIGVTLCFVAWLVRPSGPVPLTALAVASATAVAVSVVAVAAVRAAQHRPAALRCGAGATLSLLGLAGLAVPAAYAVPGRPFLAAAALPVLGGLLIVSGASRAGVTPVPTPSVAGDGSLAGYPLLTVPVAVAVVAAGYHLTAVGGFDRTATALAVGAGALLAVREALAAGDIRRYARRLAGQEAHFRSLVAGAGDLILVLDDDLVVRWQSPAAARLFGLSDQDVVGRPLAALLHPDDAAAAGGTLTAVLAPPESVDRPADGPPPPPALLRARLRDGFGQWRDTESTVSDQRAVPEVGALVLHLRDVGDRRRLERTLHRMAATDQLTALPNRAELMRALAERRAAGAVGALLTVDLSGLTGVNEERGREVGDVLLVEAAQRLRAVLGPQDVAARLAGDEFGVVTAAGPVPAYALGARLLAELTRPYELPDGMVTLQASVGMAELGEGDGAADVLRRADLARRRARQLGRDRLEWYDVGLEEQLVRRMDIERELTGAIPRGELDLAFQPVVHLLDRRPAGVEAFLRWRSPRLGTVLPAEFIPVAEDMGVAAEVADWVLATGCRHLATWLAGGNDVWLAVNMSPRQLIAPDAVARVGAALAAYRVPPERLVVEVAEARLAGDLPAVMTQLAALRALGVRTALDNFGAGQASLAQLRRLPIDILKIDGALVAEPVDRSGPDQPLVDVVVSLGRRLGLELVAEGLETEEGLTEALSAGCRLGQGYVLNRPVPAEHLEAYLENFRAPSF